ncbi:MAG TPA: SDR family NAD(P)-dependent oxidoreductase [Longimicrobium sp.]|nr:SDR family NAD(P)-dependent oxidoreductase [Longimicrobium sp.]
MDARMAGGVALVTGAASGIGRAAAGAFARAGARVVSADRGGEVVDHLAREIGGAGGSALFVPCDVGRPADVGRLVRRTMESLGRLDFAFSNAGAEGGTAPAADRGEAGWDRVPAVNLEGAWLRTREEIPRMLARGGGAVVNCSSAAGPVGFTGVADHVFALAPPPALPDVVSDDRTRAGCARAPVRP